MKTATPGPSKDIWLHLLKAGEWQTAREIRQALESVEFTNLPATLADMAEAGSLVMRRQGHTNLYAVTTTSRITRGLTLKELMQAMPQLEQAGNDSNRRASA